MDAASHSDVEITLWAIIGPAVVVVCLAGAVATVILTVQGTRVRRRGGDVAHCSWWLGALSRGMTLVGLLSFSAHLARAFMKIGAGAAGDPEVLMTSLGEAFARLFVCLLTAAIAHAGVMLLGPPRPSRLTPET
jgi:hypothetical protein